MFWDVAVALIVGMVLLWLAIAAVLWIRRPDSTTVAQTLRLLPDIVRLLTRLTRASETPRRVRVALVALLAYLASPIDLIPDFIPVIGYADDAVLVALTLRWVVRSAGADALERHWPGTSEGLDALRRLVATPVRNDP